MSARPPHGSCLPVTYNRCRDGDTIEVSVTGALVWAIRISGIDCPEKRDHGGFEASDFTNRICDDADRLSLFIPCPERVNILKELSFDRVVGDIFVESSEHNGWVSDLLVDAGHAKRV